MTDIDVLPSQVRVLGFDWVLDRATDRWCLQDLELVKVKRCWWLVTPDGVEYNCGPDRMQAFERATRFVA